MSGAESSDGGKTLLWLAALILGGLLFAAGVMVGRGLAPAPADEDRNRLARFDQRDRQPVIGDDGKLSFPTELSGPPTRPPRPVESEPRAPVDAGQPPKGDIAVAAAPISPDSAGSGSSAVDGGAVPGAGADPGRPVAASGSSFCLQVASFRLEEQAERLVERLKASGLPDVRATSGEVTGKGTYYRVRVGRFADREVAERFMESNELDALIIRNER